MAAVAIKRPAGLIFAAITLAGSGCTTPDPASTIHLAQSSWRVVAVNSRPTPATGDYSMRFQGDGRLGARFDCNHVGGSYRSTAGTVTVTNLSQTLMGCPEPAESFESEASAILAAPMEAELAEDGRLILSNPAGTIVLERLR